MISLIILRIFCLSLGLVFFFWTATEWLIYGVHMGSILNLGQISPDWALGFG
jgi:hypothetical protein